MTTVNIGTAEELQNFATRVNAGETSLDAVLTADIDLTGVSWTPIGSWDFSYRGNFDGQRHVISNLTVSVPDDDYFGLFGNVGDGSRATIQNIGCEGFDISATNFVGALVGNMAWGSISNCYAKDCTISGSGYLGGLVGYMNATNAPTSVLNCYVYDCTISGNNYVGGLTGSATMGNISNCAIYGGTHGGTLVGGSDATITNCYTSNDITSTIIHNQDFWNANIGGTLLQTYLSWDFTNVWVWDSINSLPIFHTSVVPSVHIKTSTEWTTGTPYVYHNSTWYQGNNVHAYNGTQWTEKS